MKTSKPRLFFVIGPTNAGKGTLLEALQKADAEGVGLVEVGKLMRAKYLDPKSPHYDPDHFKGQAAPKHTATEAWQMMVDGIKQHVRAGKNVIVVDGQPRDIEQCELIISEYERDSDFDVSYIHVYAPEALRSERAERRDAGDPAKLALSRTRMQGDAVGLYEVMTRLINHGSTVHTVVNDGQYTVTDYAQMILTNDPTFDGRIRCSRLWRDTEGD